MLYPGGTRQKGVRFIAGTEQYSTAFEEAFDLCSGPAFLFPQRMHRMGFRLPVRLMSAPLRCRLCS